MNWLYIAITSFLTGYGILGLFARLFGYKRKSTASCIWAGLVFVTVYAEFYSLFAGVGLTANLILLLFCFGIAVTCNKSLGEYIKTEKNRLSEEKWRLPVYGFLILLMAYGTSRGYMHFDTNLYHAQSIRWIEEYGVVPGLGNLQSRFGYNSAAFALTALYGMKEVFGQSLHATAGFFALMGAFVALDLVRVWKEKKIRLSDFARVGLVFYLSVIFGEMMSPASDYYAQILLFVILIRWLEEDERQKMGRTGDPTPYGLLCILLVYAATIKFSVAPLLLLVIKPAYMLLKKKDGKQIAVCLVSGFVTVLPFFIRNVIISGWLIYPSTIIDWFWVDWKIPKEQADYDAAEIGVYGKGMTDATKADTPFAEWFVPWFEQLKTLEKLFVLMTVVALIAGVIYLLYLFVKMLGKRKKMHLKDQRLWNPQTDFALVFSVFTVSALFWFLSAPLVRYGYAYIVALPLITFGFFYLCIMESEPIKPHKTKMYAAFSIVLILFLVTRVKGLAEEISRTYKQPYYLAQRDYEDGEATTQVVDGVTFYVPTDRGQIGYYKFPSSLLVWPIELRGESIEDGFRQIVP